MTKHGAYKNGKESPEIKSWRMMHDRCYNPNQKSFERYGGRGIRVCARWHNPNGFPHFLSDMGTRPSPDHSIDRINNEGDYEPSNCRWATHKEQMNNRCNNLFLTIEGETHTQAQWLDILKISRGKFILRYRGIRRKWLGKLGRFERAAEKENQQKLERQRCE